MYYLRMIPEIREIILRYRIRRNLNHTRDYLCRLTGPWNLTVTILLDLSPEFSELSGLPVGRTEGNYAFLSGDLPPQKSFEIRYDAAHEMRITAGEDSVVIDLGIVTADGAVQIGLQTVTPERIPLVLFKDDKPVGIIFELQK